MNDDIRPDEWIPASQAFNRAPRPRPEPKLDVEVSRATGINVGVNDPRVIKKVAEWRRANPNEGDINNNYLRDPKKVQELREALTSHL